MSNLIRKGVADFRKSLGSLLKGAGLCGERVIVTNHGKDIAALISIEELNRFNELEKQYAQQELEEVMSFEVESVAGDNDVMFETEAPLERNEAYNDLPSYDGTDELQLVAVQIDATRNHLNRELVDLQTRVADVITRQANEEVI